MIDEQRDLWIFVDIAHPLKPASGEPFGLLINHEIEAGFFVEPETEWNVMGRTCPIRSREPANAGESQKFAYALIA
jgi:hypothetical protein